MSDTAMQCPKCESELDVHERHGVVIGECPGCGGVFLDPGEVGPETTYQGRHRRGIMEQIFSGK